MMTAMALTTKTYCLPHQTPVGTAWVCRFVSSLWIHFEFTLNSLWTHFELTLNSLWIHFEFTLNLMYDYFVSMLCVDSLSDCINFKAITKATKNMYEDLVCWAYQSSCLLCLIHNIRKVVYRDRTNWSISVDATGGSGGAVWIRVQ